MKMPEFAPVICTVRNHKFKSLPNEIVAVCAQGVVVPYSHGELRLYARDVFERVLSQLSESHGGEKMLRFLAMRSHVVGSPEMLACAIGMICRQDGIPFDVRKNTAVEFVGMENCILIRLPSLSERNENEKERS